MKVYRLGVYMSIHGDDNDYFREAHAKSYSSHMKGRFILVEALKHDIFYQRVFNMYRNTRLVA